MAARRSKKSIVESDDSDESTMSNSNHSEENVTAETQKTDENRSQNTTKSQENNKKGATKKAEPGKKTRKLPPKISSEDCENMLQNFLVTKSRPYLHNELLLTFKTEATKNDIIAALTSLVEKGVLMKKEFGKTVLYLATKQVSNIPQEEIDNLKAESKTITQANNDLKEEIEQLKSELKTLCEHPINKDLKSLVEEKKTEIQENKDRIKDLSTGKVKVSKEEMVAIEKELGKLKKLSKERKLIFKTIVDAILDNSGMKKAELYEAAGIEE